MDQFSEFLLLWRTSETQWLLNSLHLQHAHMNTHTIHLFHRDLSKDVQIRPVENPAEDAIKARVVGINQRLVGYSVGHEPHPQEEEEEENVLHLNRRNQPSPSHYNVLGTCHNIGTIIFFCVSHHFANNDDFWPQLLVNCKDVNEAKSEDHVVHTKDVSAKSI